MATITLKFDVTDDNQVYLLKNFNEMAERNISININGYPLNLNIEPKAKDENNLQFGHRVINQIILITIKANAQYTDRLRKNAEVDAIKEISDNIPDNLLT